MRHIDHAGRCPDVTEWDAEMPLPEWAKAMPGPDLVHSWCSLVARTSGGRVENHSWCLGAPEHPEALASVYLIREVNLAEYVGPAIVRLARILAKIGLRPFTLDIAFCELPLLHLPGFMVSPGVTPERRMALWRALLERTRRDLKVPLFAARVFPDSPEARFGGVPQVPFVSSYVISLPEEGWKKSLKQVRRKKINYMQRQLAKQGGGVEIHADDLPDPESLDRLYGSTLKKNADGLQHPVSMGPELLGELENLPSGQRWIVGVYVQKKLVAFCLALKTGGRMLLRTCGVDSDASRPVHGYFQLDFAAIPFAEEIGCSEVDMGPTSEGPKLRLGAQPEPTAYLMDFRHVLLWPLRLLLTARFRAEATPQNGNGASEK